jgi:hypothetical protein
VLWQGTGRQASVLSGIESHQILGSIRLKKIYDNTDTIATFASIGVNYDFRKFPYTNIKECPITTVQREYLSIEVKTNY